MIPALVPLLALVWGILSFFARNLRVAPIISIMGSFTILCVSSGVLFLCSQGEIFNLQVGGWPSPVGISLRVDLTSALMIWISSLITLGVHFYSLSTLVSVDALETKGFHSVWHFLAAGVYGSFSTGDLFNLFVWFEMLLLASFVLMSMGGRHWRLRGNIYYVIINLVGSAIFLLGLGFLYNSTGTLNFEDLQQLEIAGYTKHIAALAFLIAFGMKAAVFPFYSWLPASYPTTAIAPLSIFAGLLTKVGVYALLRFFGSPSILQAEWIGPLLFIVAGLTMLLGVYGAAVKMTMRKILAFHIVSQIGYMILGIAIGGKVGLTVAIFYLMHHMVVKTNLFLITGAIEFTQKQSDLKKVGGLARQHPWIAAGFAISALSLAGVPPFSGFWAKLFTLYAAASYEAYISLTVGIVCGLLTLFSMIKIWNNAFLKELKPKSTPRRSLPWTMGLPIFVFCLWIIFIGLNPKWLLALSEQAAMQLLGVSE